ncbi:imelysin family protein [Maribacter sp. 2307ULW6-5]|uniref:imelysin family protein n=1 Tax=Maribacter sp. 2307ULW6-5 TaxID=3386275 RepID=UPI0039BD4F71
MLKKSFVALLFLGLLWACSTDSENGPDNAPGEATFDRAPLLTNWADNIIIPSYEAFLAQLADLNGAFETFEANANADNLVALRSAWAAAYTSWQRVSMFEIGPAESVGLRLNVNIYPTDSEKIAGHIASGNYDLSLSSNRDAKGFPALDWLINGLAEDDAAILGKYTGEDREATLAYTAAVLEDMTMLTTNVLNEWKDNYRDTFVANDGASATASVDRFVNDYIFYYEKFLRAGKMGIPLGVFSGTALPSHVEAYYDEELSNALFLEGLDAVQDFFNGRHTGSSGQGESLASYLDALNTVKDGEDLAAIINEQFNAARSSVTGLAPFKQEIQDNATPTNMLLAYDEVQKAVPLLKVDMVSAMSISIDFVDADGD